jgi:carbon-monoxide dehydrogenase medium subunit
MFHRFRIAEPTTVEEAVELLRGVEGAKVVAGSTAVTLMLRQGLINPPLLVSVARLEGLRDIRVDGGVLEIGALCTHRSVEESEVVREHVPLLAEAFGRVGNIRVRNVATVGGVLAEADYASDPPAALLALDAEVIVRGPESRSIAIDEFFVGFYETALEPHEILTAVRVPIPPRHGYCFSKYTSRSSEDRPCVSVAAMVQRGPDGVCGSARVAVGGAAEVPFRVPEAEDTLSGLVIDQGLAATVGSAYANAVEPLSDMRGSAWYRRQMISVWVGRALLAAAEMAATSGGKP